MNSELRTHKFLIIADGHYNPLGIIRSLGHVGIKSDVILIGSPRDIITHSKYIDHLTFSSTPAEAVAIALSQYKEVAPKAFLMTGGDKIISAIDQRYDEIKNIFHTYNCGAQGGINLLLTKAKQNELALSVGFNVPDFEEVNVGELPSKVKYPIITKAVNSTITGWKSLTYICHNKKELLNAYSKMKCPRILLQQYIEKENETGFNGISINEGREAYFPLQLSYFSTTETTFGNAIYLFQPTDKDLCEKIRKFIQLSGYSGTFSIDFIIGKDKQIYFLEMNFRNSAWSYPYTCAGVNLPLLWAKSTLSGKINTSLIKIKKVPFTSIVELWELSSLMKKGMKEGMKVLWQILHSDSYIFWDYRDPKPFYYYCIGWLKSHFL